MRALNIALIAVATVTFGTACIVPTGQTTDPTAGRPHGTTAAIFIDLGPRVTGELLEMRDTAFVLMTEREIVLIPFRIVNSAGFAQKTLSYYGSRPHERTHQQLRLRSRFPQGMSPEILAKLLALKGQESLTVITR